MIDAKSKIFLRVNMDFSPGKLSRVLEEPISDSFKSDVEVQDSCALSIQKPCCEGRGFNLSMVGSKTVASICDCVKECATCLGHAVKVDASGRSYPCTKNPPTKTVNFLLRN